MALFIVGSVGSNLIGVETTPFFVWGMFSQPTKPAETYTAWRIDAGNGRIAYHDWNTSLFQRYMLTNTLDYAARMQTLGKDPTRHFVEQKLGDRYAEIEPYCVRITNRQVALPAFAQWYRGYVGAIYGVPSGSVRVTRQVIDNQHFKVVDEQPFLPLSDTTRHE